VEHRVHRRHLVAHEVGDREHREHDERTGAAQVVERLSEIDEVEPLRERRAEQRKPRVEARRGGQAEGRANAGQIHGGSLGARADGESSGSG
jgi:hypothetical protein